MARRFLLFSGHNDRAVVTLCRFFAQAGLPFCIVSSGRGDLIHDTTWNDHVIFNRLDNVIDVAWLRQLATNLTDTLIYCPTNEFMNDFLLVHRDALHGCGLEISLPERAVYDELTSKSQSQVTLTALCHELRLPSPQNIHAPHAPCVLKPVQNVAGGRVLYPLLCRTPAELARALTGLDRSNYFAQDLIVGQSHYLCAYLARDGSVASFWQTNLMQQPGGKSIVLARPGANPGVNEARLFAGLHQRGYHGPFMMEVIVSDSGIYYIEINPRFWGPLQLALDVCPAILGLFVRDHGFEVKLPAARQSDQACYAWAFGAATPGCVMHPAAHSLPPQQIQQLLHAHDVYAREDTRALHACH
ncbi:MAG: hypothetical protein WC100_21060 [Sterolibacterium sp.]